MYNDKSALNSNNNDHNDNHTDDEYNTHDFHNTANSSPIILYVLVHLYIYIICIYRCCIYAVTYKHFTIYTYGCYHCWRDHGYCHYDYDCPNFHSYSYIHAYIQVARVPRRLHLDQEDSRDIRQKGQGERAGGRA